MFKKINWKVAGIFFVICLVYIAVVVLAIIGPSKFFSSPTKEGISLLRDDQELGVYYNRTFFYRAAAPPYRDNRIEYPLLGVGYLTVPYFFSSQTFDNYRANPTEANVLLLFGEYRANLMIINMLLLFVLLVMVYYTAPPGRRHTARLLLFILPSIIYFVFNRFDIWPAVLIQLSLLLLFRQKFAWAFFALSAAFLAKGYAIVLFPVFLMYYLNKKNKELAILTNKPLLFMVIPTILAVGMACLWSGLEDGLFPYIFQSTRTFDSGSMLMVYLGALYSMIPPWLWSRGVALLGYALTFLQILFPILIYSGHMVFKKYIQDEDDVINWSLLVLLVYILFSVYYSPQWILWVLPLFVFFFRTKQELLVFIIYDIINYAQYPLAWNTIGPQSVAFSMIVLIRSILLVTLICLVGQRIWKKRMLNHTQINQEYVATN